MEAIIVLAFPVGMIALVVYLVVKQNKERARRNQLLGEALRAQDPTVIVDQKKGSAACIFRGLPSRFRFATRGSGSSAESWTEAECDIAHEHFVLSIRRQHARDDNLLRKGLAVDLQVGNPQFDAQYLVEGAPSSLILRLLTPEIQRKILQCNVDEIDEKPFGMAIARKGWKEDQANIQAFMDLVVSIAERIAPALAESKLADAPPPESAYRGGAMSPADQQRWQSAQWNAASQRQAEIAHVEQTRLRRKAYERNRMIVVIGLIMGFVVLSMVWGRNC